MKSRITKLLEYRKNYKLNDVYMMSVINSIREKLQPQDVKEVDKRTRQSVLLKPPGTGNDRFMTVTVSFHLTLCGTKYHWMLYTICWRFYWLAHRRKFSKACCRLPKVVNHPLYHYPADVFCSCLSNENYSVYTPQSCVHSSVLAFAVHCFMSFIYLQRPEQRTWQQN